MGSNLGKTSLIWFGYFLWSFCPVFLVVGGCALLLYAISNGVHSEDDFLSMFDLARSRIMGWGIKRPLMLGDAVMYASFISVMILVAINTLIVYLSFRSRYRHEPNFGAFLDVKQTAMKKRARRLEARTLELLIVTVVLLVVWIIFSLNGDFFAFGYEHFSWRFPSDQSAGHEIVMLLVFCLFLCIDLLSVRARQQEVTLWNAVSDGGTIKAPPGHALDTRNEIKEHLRRLEIERRFVRDCIWFVDIPVIMGVVVVAFAHSYLHENRWRILADRDQPVSQRSFSSPGNLDIDVNAFERDGRFPLDCEAGDRVCELLASQGHAPISAQNVSRQRQRRRFEGFLLGLSTGAVLMHVALSQFIFCILLLQCRWAGRALRL